MIDKAAEFTRKGDEVFSALAEHFPSANHRRLCVEQPVPSGRISQIRAAAAAYISTCLGHKGVLSEAELLSGLLEQRETLPNYRADGLLVPKREHVLEFNLLHRSIAGLFRDFGIEGHVDSIDLPVNVRVVFGKPSTGRTNLPYSSSKIHSDVWAGVPVDAVVVVLPIFGDIENITISCGEMAPEQELEAMRVMDDYLEGRSYRVMKPYTDAPLRHGHVYLCDARLLHQTVRHRREGVRISVDFRFRLNDPEYRRLAPAVRGPDSMDHTVPYPRWLAAGTEAAIVFDESAALATERTQEPNGAPYGFQYRLVDLFSGSAA